MDPASLAQAALGIAAEDLLKLVKDVAINAAAFKSTLKSLELILRDIAPAIEDISNINRKLDLPEQETEMFTTRLKEGLELVRKCNKVPWWNLYAKSSHRKKLKELEGSLSQFFQIQVQAQQLRDVRLTRWMLETSYQRETTERTSGFVGSCEVTGYGDFVVGLEEPLHELKMPLLNNEVRVVVISAPGGCGKTTLAKVLCHDDQIKGTFKDIFFVTASKAANLEVIIKILFKHKNYSVPDFQNDEEAINQFECMLKKNGKNPSLYHTCELKPLKHQDAMALFSRSALKQDGNCYIPNDLVNEIVRHCGGFPLALEVVGRSLCGQPVATWKHTLKHWSEGESIFDSNNKLLNCLLISLKHLNEKKKECYLDLASFPEDQRISATALVDMWVEMYNLDEDGAIDILIELSNRNLVNLVHTRKDISDDCHNNDFVTQHDGCLDEDLVTQHDLLRELAIHQTVRKPIQQRERLVVEIRDNDLPRWWTEQNNYFFHARLLSISTDEMFSSNWCSIHLPKVEVLVLNIQGRNYSCPQFMEEMDQLKVLNITNYSFYSTKISNFPLIGFLSSLKRIRLEHVSVSSISSSILQLKNLRKISLIMCEIGEALSDYTIQSPEILPNLSEIVFDCCSNLVDFPAWLCHVISLEKLTITNCHEMVLIPERIGNLKNLNMLNLHACTKLPRLPESIGSLHKLGCLDISDCISLSRLPERLGELCGLKEFRMRGCRGLLNLPLSVENLEQLKVVTCDEEIGYLWEAYRHHLSNLNIEVVKEDVNLNWLDMKW
ncbi:hypothetical protein NMG60_11026103 [Bertholletia excelsa]